MSWRELYSELRSDVDLRAQRESLDAKHAIGSSVHRLRKQRDMSQTELAERVGTGQPNISAIERGDGNPTVETLAKIAAALDTDIPTLHERRQFFLGDVDLSVETRTELKQSGKQLDTKSERPWRESVAGVHRLRDLREVEAGPSHATALAS